MLYNNRDGIMRKTQKIIVIQIISLIILLLFGIVYQSISYSSINNTTTTKRTSFTNSTEDINKTKEVTSTSINNASTITTKKKDNILKKTTTAFTTSTTTTKKIEKYYYYKWLNDERDYTGRTCLLIYDQDGNISKGYVEILYYNKYLKKQYITDNIKECFLEDMKSVNILNVIVDEVKYEQ